jgi:endonuclease YncB( thermonuclease family)
MADPITLNYKGLTGKRGTITVSDPDAVTVVNLIPLIIADEDPTVGVLTNNDYDIAVQRDTSITDVNNGSDTCTVAGIVDGDTIICIDDKKNLLTTNTKEVRQERKGRIASVNREREGKTAFTWNKNRLPNPYEGNLSNPDDDENTGTLQAQRPWT